MSKVQTTPKIDFLLRNRPDLHKSLKMSTNQWKRNPTGKGHTIQQKMFKNHLIFHNATASAIHKLNPEFEGKEDLDRKIVHKNQPVLMTVYKDPESKEENCVLLRPFLEAFPIWNSL